MTHRKSIKGYVGAGEFSKETRTIYHSRQEDFRSHPSGLKVNDFTNCITPADTPIIRFFKRWYKPNWEEKYEEYLTREGVYAGGDND